LKKTVCVITGATASGKTDIAIKVANHFETHILSADSRQFYRELKIGAASPSADELALAPHHFIGHLSVADSYNVYKFEQDALALCTELFKSNQILILTGGSGLYIDALVNGIDLLPDPDPQIRESLNQLYLQQGILSLREKLKRLDPIYYDFVDQSNPVRLIRAIEVCLLTGNTYSSLRNQVHENRPFEVVKIVLNRPKVELHKRIELRADQMIEQGLVDEVKSLIPFRIQNSLKTVGYKEIFQYLDGEISMDQALENIKTNTRRYAKRQLTWFRRDLNYQWIDVDDVNATVNLIVDKINKSR